MLLLINQQTNKKSTKKTRLQNRNTIYEIPHSKL